MHLVCHLEVLSSEAVRLPQPCGVDQVLPGHRLAPLINALGQLLSVQGPSHSRQQRLLLHERARAYKWKTAPSPTTECRV